MTMDVRTLTPQAQAQLAAAHTCWKEKTERVDSLETQLEAMKKKLPTSVKGGPCEKSLDIVLRRHHIVRQEYHGGAFVGNHVAGTLQKKVLQELTSAPAEVVAARAQHLQPDIEVIASRYKRLLTEYAACRAISIPPPP